MAGGAMVTLYLLGIAKLKGMETEWYFSDSAWP